MPGQWCGLKPHGPLQFSEEARNRIRQGTDVRDHLSWYLESRAVEQLCRSGVRIFSPRRPHAQQDDGKVVHPFWTGEAGPECTLQLSVEVLHQPVRLWMVGRCLMDLDPEEEV